MKLRNALPILVLCVSSFSLLFAAAPSKASNVLIPFQAPAIITTPDYIDRFQSPPPSMLPGQMFLSKEGYLFSFDTVGRRIYHVPPSYILASPGGNNAPLQFIAAPMIFMHPAAFTAPVMVAPPGTLTPGQNAYIVVP